MSHALKILKITHIAEIENHNYTYCDPECATLHSGYHERSKLGSHPAKFKSEF